MPEILAVPEKDFPKLRMANGGWRWQSKELWDLHKAHAEFVQHPPDVSVKPHTHTVDEVLIILEGSIALGGGAAPMPAGGIVFIGANTPYGFTVGKQGVKWLAIRPKRADLAHMEQTDLKWAESVATGQGKAQMMSPEDIEKIPWVSAPGDPDVRLKRIISTPGYSSVTLIEMKGSGAPQKPSRPRFYYVTKGSLRIDGKLCGPGFVVSIPPGMTYTGSAEGKATFWMVEAAT